MLMMKSVRTAAPGTVKVAEILRPAPGSRDLLVRVRACGICGTDADFVQMGGIPLGPNGETASIPLGHEPAGEVLEIGAEVTGLKTGDRVVVNPQAAPSGIIGCGGPLGGMSEYLLIRNAVAGQSVAVSRMTCPSRSPRSTSQPMAVARHCVNRSQARTADKVIVFGAGPIGLGAVIWLKLRGVRQVAVADVIPGRLRTALAAGADAVIDSHTYQVLSKRSRRLPKVAAKLDWPPNLWLGVSVEDASQLSRIDDLRAVPAAVRFLSCEPLLGPLDGLDLAGINWVIAGGESGC